MTPLPHAEIRIRLPPLSGEQALQICNVLDDIIAALWRVHGDAILDRLADLETHHHQDLPAPEPADDINGSSDADDIPF